MRKHGYAFLALSIAAFIDLGTGSIASWAILGFSVICFVGAKIVDEIRARPSAEGR